ncbi:tetratricopeptide repeat protein, partial [Myxococcota bacterium]|nr:tetratricopeptide repeat protein [Myxococcota bacterium]
KKEEANKDLSLFTDWESTASGLTARVFLAMDTPEMEKVYPIVEKNDVYLRDPYFYAVVSRSYLMGNRKDRLLRAKFYIDKILRLTPESFDSKILMGRVLIESGKFEQGERIMKENMESKEASGDDLFAWVDLEISLRRFGPAMDALEIGAKRFPKDTRIPFTRAEIYLGRNDPRKALEYLSKIKKIKGVEGKYHLLEGRCYLKLRESKRAEKAFSLAVKADPNSAHSHFLYGEILIKNNRVGRSVKYLEKAIILEMKARSTIKDYQKSDWLSRAHYLLGGVFKELGQRKKAALHFQKFAQMVPEGPLKDEAMRLLRSINAD